MRFAGKPTGLRCTDIAVSRSHAGGRSRLDTFALNGRLVRHRVHGNGGIISTMCAGATTPRIANLPLPKREGEAVAYDADLRTATSIGPGVAMESACLLVRELVGEEEYRSFRNYNPWLFGSDGQYPPRMESLK